MAAELLGAEFTKAYEEFFGVPSTCYRGGQLVGSSGLGGRGPDRSNSSWRWTRRSRRRRAMGDPITGLDTESVVVERSSLESGEPSLALP